MLRPIDARIVVKKPKREEKTESGIPNTYRTTINLFIIFIFQ